VLSAIACSPCSAPPASAEKHRGFAFVQFEDKDDAAEAMDNMNNAELYGRVSSEPLCISPPTIFSPPTICLGGAHWLRVLSSLSRPASCRPASCRPAIRKQRLKLYHPVCDYFQVLKVNLSKPDAMKGGHRPGAHQSVPGARGPLQLFRSLRLICGVLRAVWEAQADKYFNDKADKEDKEA
jgi:hypothetical protein